MEISVVGFAGGINAAQCGPFLSALAKLQSQLLAEERDVVLNCLILYNRNLRENNIDQGTLIDILAQSHIHIILSHMHQGNDGWNHNKLHQDLVEKLGTHRGWPSGDNLLCPVFTQNKYNYIKCCREICIPTLAVEFDESTPSLNEDCGGHIVEFMQHHTEGKGWVVKLPYHTNGVGLHFCKDKEAVFNALRLLCLGYANSEYAMLQPCLSNRREYKVVLLGGTARYVSDINQRDGLGVPFSSPPHLDILRLAEMAGEMLEARCVGANITPLLRVDIMQSANGLVVNEFEGLEACYYSKTINHEFHTTSFLEEFWFQTLQCLVYAHIHAL